MSAKAVFWALEQRHLKPTDKLVLIVLANFANDRNECWPSYQRIARDAVISRRTAIEILKRLEILGVVKIEARRNGEGRQNSNIFKLQISASVKQIKPKNQSAESSPIDEDFDLDAEEIAPEETPKTRVQNSHPLVQIAPSQSAVYDTSLVKNLHPSVSPASPEPNNEFKNCGGVGEFVTKTATALPIDEQPTEERKFRMPNNWQPSREFKTRADKHGVKSIDELDLDEFRMHWSEELRQLTQSQWENKFLENLLLRQGMKIKKIKTPSPVENPANETMGKLEALRRLRSLGKLSDYSKIDAQIAAAENELQQIRGTA